MPAGDLDRPFGIAGFAAAAFAREGAWGTAVAVAPDGAIVAVGGAIEAGAQAFAIARFRPDGLADDTFGDGRPAPGCVLVRFPDARQQEARAVLIPLPRA